MQLACFLDRVIKNTWEQKKGFDFKQKNNHGYLWPDLRFCQISSLTVSLQPRTSIFLPRVPGYEAGIIT